MLVAASSTELWLFTISFLGAYMLVVFSFLRPKLLVLSTSCKLLSTPVQPLLFFLFGSTYVMKVF
ncbi:hypothetical protein E1A91_D06G055300v1 [Gossypium mustelinum]|uniref:Uncharacterized protein n=1 Tax=Gossypium mustelinum TaxID=34275 RepID=A0A5D2UEU3_GOSMU|nr:hypothetical protein E1A91_D06G055300v1 [Gossypium mustelinum]